MPVAANSTPPSTLPDGSILEAPFVAIRTVSSTGSQTVRVLSWGPARRSFRTPWRSPGGRVPPLYPLAGTDPLVVARLGAATSPTGRAPGPVYLRAPDAKPQPPQAELAP